jgi:dTDP-4-amino-4,6-dideoxygalactose transaminase
MDAYVKRGHDAAESGAKAVTNLAVLGAAPAFSEAIHVGRPNIGNRQRFLERIETMLDRRYLTNSGPFERELEQRLSEMLGVRYCVAMCNATIALEIAIRALNLTGEVIVPSFTFVATAHALQWQQITPVFCDIDPLTHNINPRKIEHLITPRTTGILAVHLWGRPCAIEELQAIADANGLALLFDAAHAFGCTYGTRKIGGFGRAEVLSFHATKFISAGEGGAVVTDDAALAERMQLMKNFGFAGYDNVISIGTNGKMNELSAAMGLTHLESLEEFARTNRTNFETYEHNLGGIRGLSLLRYDEKNSPNFQYVVVEVDAGEIGLSRDQLLSVLHAENILARRYFYPGVHRMEPYRSQFPEVGSLLPETEAIADRVLVLPTGTGVTPADIRKICAIIGSAVEHRREIAATLPSQLNLKDWHTDFV